MTAMGAVVVAAAAAAVVDMVYFSLKEMDRCLNGRGYDDWNGWSKRREWRLRLRGLLDLCRLNDGFLVMYSGPLKRKLKWIN